MSALERKKSFRIDPLIGEKADHVVHGLLSLLEEHHPLTVHHSQRVSHSGILLAQELGLSHDGVVNVGLAGLLHDIGKIEIDADLLDKAPTSDGKGLTDEEYETLREHVTYSHNILSRFPQLSDIADIAGSHHERMDGSGYPNGLTGNQIPLEARIVAVADVFDAITHDRHYRHGRPLEEAFEDLKKNSPRLFDINVVSALERILERILPYKHQMQYIQSNLAKLIKRLPPEQIIAVILYSGAKKFYFDTPGQPPYPQDIDVALITEGHIPDALFSQFTNWNGWRVDRDSISPAFDRSVRLMYDPGLQRPIDLWVEPFHEFYLALQGKGDHNHRKIPMHGYAEDNSLTPHQIAKRIAEGVVIYSPHLDLINSVLGTNGILIDSQLHDSITKLLT